MNKNVLIIQNYNINKGDASVVKAMQLSLKKMYPNINVNLTSFDPTKAFAEYQVQSSDWLINYREIKKSKGLYKFWFYIVEIYCFISSLLWLLLYKFGFNFDFFLTNAKKRTIQMYLNAKVILLPGGHFFTTLNKFPVVFSHFYALWFGHLLGKKTMIYAQTFGPFHGLWSIIVKFLTLKAINFSSLVTVREKDSLKYDRGKKIVETGESVFLLKNPKSENNSKIISPYKIKNRKIVGVTIHHIYYVHFFSRKRYTDLMTNILKNIIKEGYSILFIPMESIRKNNTGDRKLIKEIVEKIDCNNFVNVVEDDLKPSLTEALISNLDIFIGTKTHSIVYGLKNAIPTIAIAYQEKSNQFMNSFNVLENSINLASLTEDTFSKIFQRVASNPELYSKKEALALQKVIVKAKKNNILLNKLLKEN